MIKKLSGNRRSLLFTLWHKHKYFSKQGKLTGDGSFYYDDKRLASEQDISTKTIKRAKEFLKEHGYINYEAGTCRGHATKYWLLRKPDKKSPFVDISKPDNLSAKPDNLSLKAPQNVTPNNINNKEINKEAFSDINNEKGLKDGIKGLIKTMGVDYAKRFYVDRGFSEEVIQKMIDSLQRDGGRC